MSSDGTLCYNWDIACVGDGRDGDLCTSALDSNCDAPNCTSEVCTAVGPEDAGEDISNWCNKCTGDDCYDWKRICESEPNGTGCTSSLALICKHQNTNCRDAVCAYTGDSTVKNVLDDWCGRSWECKFEEVVEEAEEHPKMDVTAALSTVLVVAAVKNREGILDKAGEYRSRAAEWWVPDVNPYTGKMNKYAPSIYDQPEYTIRGNYPESNLFEMWRQNRNRNERVPQDVFNSASRSDRASARSRPSSPGSTREELIGGAE